MLGRSEQESSEKRDSHQLGSQIGRGLCGGADDAVNMESPIESNAVRLGSWVDVSVQEFSYARFSFHHSYLCEDNAFAR